MLIEITSVHEDALQWSNMGAMAFQNTGNLTVWATD